MSLSARLVIHILPGQRRSGTPVPVRAIKFIRKMRGGAQSHLIQASNGEFYVVKSTNNPQQRRTLVNEWLSGAVLRHLGIFVPDTTLIELTPEFIADAPDLYISLGSRRQSIPPGIHFGSRLAVDPEKVAIFDFLPDAALRKVVNLNHFLGVLVFDQWFGNTDSRQAVFSRGHLKSRLRLNGHKPAEKALCVQMIDHGFAFNGSSWKFQDSALQGVYFRSAVYGDVHSLHSFEPWLSAVEQFPVEILDSARREIPPHWLEDDEHRLEQLLETLLKRRSRVSSLIREIQRTRPGVFANWGGPVMECKI